MPATGHIALPIDDIDSKRGFLEEDELVYQPYQKKESRRRKALAYSAVALLLIGGIAIIPIASAPANVVPDALATAWDYSKQKFSEYWPTADDLDRTSEPLDSNSALHGDMPEQSLDQSPTELLSHTEPDTKLESAEEAQPVDAEETIEEIHEEEAKENQLDIMLPVTGKYHMPILSESRPRTPAAELDAKYCPDGNCKFLFPAKVFEQESKAQQHIYALALMAHALNRTLVLPHVKGSRIGACYGNPFTFYYERDALDQLGFKTILQDDLFDWINKRDQPPTAQVVDMTQVLAEENPGSMIIHHDEIPTRFPTRDQDFCIQKPQSYLDFSHWSPVSFLPPPDFKVHRNTRMDYGMFVLDSLRTPSIMADSRRGSLDSGATPDVQLVFYEGSSDYFEPRYLQNLTTLNQAPRINPTGFAAFRHFQYSDMWQKIADHISSNLGNFISVHWRQESLVSDPLPVCAEKLLDMLKDIHSRFPALKTVYLATDYPLEALEKGEEAPRAHSDTFRAINEDHHSAMRRVLAAFESGEMGELKLTTFAREIESGTLGIPGLDINDMDPGVVAIVDKAVSMDAEVFVAGTPRECGRDSSFTRQITDSRVSRLKDQVAFEGGEKHLEVGYTWNTVRYFGISSEILSYTQQNEWLRERTKFNLKDDFKISLFK